jgi:hypothetical protein
VAPRKSQSNECLTLNVTYGYIGSIGQAMSDVRTSNSFNIGDRGHMIYESYVVFHAESESAIRIAVSLTVREIERPTGV